MTSLFVRKDWTLAEKISTSFVLKDYINHSAAVHLYVWTYCTSRVKYVPDNSSFKIEVAYNFFKYDLSLILYIKFFFADWLGDRSVRREALETTLRKKKKCISLCLNTKLTKLKLQKRGNAKPYLFILISFCSSVLMHESLDCWQFSYRVTLPPSGHRLDAQQSWN